MHKFVALGAGALLMASPMAAAAQNGPMLEAGVVEVNEVFGADVGAGWRFNAGNFHLTPAIGGFIYQGEEDRYYMDRMKNGSSQCRDRSTGQFAKKELCNESEIEAYGRIEATAHYRRLEGGVGYRTSNMGDAVYGTASYKFAPYMAVKANISRDYFGLFLVMR